MSDETVCLVDFLATCAEMMGDRLPENAGEDSVSNLPVWQGQSLDKSLRQATVHSSMDGSLSVRKGTLEIGDVSRLWRLELSPARFRI